MQVHLVRTMVYATIQNTFMNEIWYDTIQCHYSATILGYKHAKFLMVAATDVNYYHQILHK
jgi:hypothetical protein